MFVCLGKVVCIHKLQYDFQISLSQLSACEFAWICGTTRKIVVRCFDVLLVDTIGDTHLIEVKEETSRLTFYNISLIGLETPTLFNGRFTPKLFHLNSCRVISQNMII